MMRIDVMVSDRDGTVHSVVSGEHLLEGMAEVISDQVTRFFFWPLTSSCSASGMS